MFWYLGLDLPPTLSYNNIYQQISPQHLDREGTGARRRVSHIAEQWVCVFIDRQRPNLHRTHTRARTHMRVVQNLRLVTGRKLTPLCLSRQYDSSV